MHTTTNHPWLTAAHGWLPAGFLHVGERVVRADGTTVTVAAVRAVPGAAAMWDLSVGNVHTFVVGVGLYVVHNCGGAAKAQDFRDQWNLTDPDRNVGYGKADWNDGTTEEVFGTSGKSTGDSLPKPNDADRLFSTYQLDDYKETRFDSEVKILEHYGAKLEANPDLGGNIYVFSERFPCGSCQGVIDQFRARFGGRVNLAIDSPFGGY